jgi:hypothetical protein
MALFEVKPKFYYEPHLDMTDKNKCVDLTEYLELVKAIDGDSSLTTNDKNFFKILATRFIVFKYEKLADLYASTKDANIKRWLEALKSVIVDTDKAIESGYFKYLNDYSMLLEDIVDEK